MGIYIEAVILYILIFLSGTAAQFTGTQAQTGGFPVIGEIARLILFYIPALALVWYMMLRTWKLEYWVLRPGKKDIICGLITLPCLLIIGLEIAFLSSNTGSSISQTTAQPPSSVLGWTVLIFSCILSAYLEESYFRFYLISRRQELNLNPTSALALSTALFSICHISGGPWSFLNAALCGAFLGFMFLKYNSFHGIAAAHGLYNIASYILSALIIKT